MFHVLIADDIAEKRDRLAEAVSDVGFGVPTVCLRHAHEALAHIQANYRAIILAIFDHTFGGEPITGIDLTIALRPLNPDSNIYLVTSHPRSTEEYLRREREAQKHGATGSFSTNMRPYDGYDWLYMELCEKKTDLLRKFGLLQGSPKHSTKD